MCGRQGQGVMTATVSISSFKHSAKGHKQNEKPIRPYDLFTYLDQKMPVFREVELPDDRINNEFTMCSVMSDFTAPLCCSLPGFSDQEILQARILEWDAIPFSRDLPNRGIKPGCPTLQADSLLSAYIPHFWISFPFR